VDTSGALLNDATTWGSLVGRFRPRVRRKSADAPRSALVCFPCDDLMRGPEHAHALAQSIRSRLEQAAEALGVRFPVYVVFTRADRIRSFAEYVAGLTQEEAIDQVVGASFAVPAAEPSGLHADEAERKFGGAFDTIYGSLATGRLEQLARAAALPQRAALYQFPREFSKLRAAIVKVLTELDRPRRLVMSPFVRGFYFSGVRPVVTETMTAPPAKEAPAPAAQSGGDATRMFHMGAAAPAQSPVRPGPTLTKRRVPQWMFLRPLFNTVLLGDTAARTVSSGSVHVTHRRRFVYAAAIATCAVAMTLLIVSLVANRGLMTLPRTAGTAVAAQGNTPAVHLAPVEQLRELDALRAKLLELYDWQRDGRPLHMNWGLYAGDDVRPAALRIYFRRFTQLLWDQVHRRNTQTLRMLPATRRDTDQYDPSYYALKAHLVMTSEHRRPATDWRADWLSRWLFNEWAGLHPAASAEQKALAQQQFDFYAARLREENPFPSDKDGTAVTSARKHLSSFSNIDHIYARLRAAASAASEPVRFPVAFPSAAGFVTNTYTVDGAWTANGWNAMNKSLLAEKFGGEEWVLGQRALTIQNPEQLRADILNRYTRDYIEQWVQYLRRTSVVPYRDDPKDAATKLRELSQANRSPLLASLWLASQHTTVSDNIRKEFGAVHAVVAPAADGSRNFITPTSQQYTAVLANLAAAVEAYSAGVVPDQVAAAAQVKVKAIDARSAVDTIAGVLPAGAAARAVADVLEQPITAYNVPDPARAAAAKMNDAAKAFCSEWKTIAGKYPLSRRANTEATVTELAGFLARPLGRLAKLEAALGGALQFNGSEWVANPAAEISPAFRRFFDAAARLGRALFPDEGATQPNLKFSLGGQPADPIASITVTVDGNAVTYKSQDVKTFRWTGSPSSEIKVQYLVVGGSLPIDHATHSGTWSVFRFLDDAQESTPTHAGTRLLWTVSSGAGGKPQSIGGKPLAYQFVIQPVVLTREHLSRLQCVPQVTMK
jgi:type VI secretion system protein ImpL